MPSPERFYVGHFLVIFAIAQMEKTTVTNVKSGTVGQKRNPACGMKRFIAENWGL